MGKEKVRVDWLVLQEEANFFRQYMVRQYGKDHADGRARVYGIPKGGMIALGMLFHSYADICIVNRPEDADVFLDDIVDSGATSKRYFKKYNKLTIALVDRLQSTVKLFKDKWIVFPWECGDTEETVEDNVTRILQYIGEDVTREGLVETPNRVVRSFETLYGGYGQDVRALMKTFSEGACDEMVILTNIEFFSTCEHHMLPFYGKAHIAYIPQDKVIGISKLARLLEVFARRLQIQERIGQEVTEALMEHLNPHGAACVLEAQHHCMTSRGVQKQGSVMKTASLTGCFKENTNTRQEFYSLIQKK